DPEVREVTTQFLAQCVVLELERLVSVHATPVRKRPQPPTKSAGHRPPLHHRVSLPRQRPEVREPQKVECPGGSTMLLATACRGALGPLERHQARLLGMERQTVPRKPLGSTAMTR